MKPKDFYSNNYFSFQQTLSGRTSSYWKFYCITRIPGFILQLCIVCASYNFPRTARLSDTTLRVGTWGRDSEIGVV